MLLIICGEDTVSSRSHLVGLRRQYEAKGYQVKKVEAGDIDSVSQIVSQPNSLFYQNTVYFSEHLGTRIKKNRPLLAEFEKIESYSHIDWINWEEGSAWDLNLPKIGKIKEFKPGQTIFKLIDSLYPTNKKQFLSNLNSYALPENEHFIFSMTIRLIRNLLLVKSGVVPARMQAWQAGKLQRQAAYWSEKRLGNFYEALFKIEVSLKTSASPFSLKESLAILACHFL